MRILTIKAKPKTIFGVILALTGVIVILLTFVSNHGVNKSAEQAMAEISCATEKEREQYLSSLGWEFSDTAQEKEITVPSQFNQVYEDYNKIQKEQGFDLEQYKGCKATLYTYKITNYTGNNNVTADLIICGGMLIGADLCDTSASDGFLTALSENGTT